MKQKLNIRPLADQVLLEPEAVESKTESGIIIPDAAQKPKLKGRVVAKGKDVTLVNIGDFVMHKKHFGTELSYQGKNYIIMPEEGLLAVITEQ